MGLDPKRDLRPMAFVRFNTRLGKAKPVTIRALLDSGASESLVLEKHTDKLRVKELKTKGTVWSTPAGELHTHSKTKAQFTIPELQDKRWDSIPNVIYTPWRLYALTLV